MKFDYRTSTGLGKQTVGGHKQNLVYTTQEKGAVTPQETEPGLPVSVQGSPAVKGRQWPAEGSRALNATVLGARHVGIKPFDGGRHYCH